MNIRKKKEQFPKMFALGLFLSSIGFIGFILLLIKKYLDGTINENYFNHFGIELNYLGILILLLLIPAFLLIALGIRYWQKREENDLLNKYSSKKQNGHT